MTWWVWLVLGLALTALELVASGGFYLIFFGISALVVGGLDLLGLVTTQWLQWLLFAVVSVCLLLLFRNPLLKMIYPRGAPVDLLVGEVAIPLDDIPAGEVGRAELRGTTWSARNAHGAVLSRGRRCRVERVDGLMLFLTPE